jgi:pimeloyl-ACP methyl ester carboxylesterase
MKTSIVSQLVCTAGLLLSVSFSSPFLHAQVATQATHSDPSPHRVFRVGVTRQVQLEVLDWGGTGAPLIFLAGGGNTAHIYDGFAPRFTSRYRVFGITRRGFGASSHPASGYDTTTLARDILAVLDSLGLKRASFVGHSFAGTELSYLGAYFPERVERLLYLDAGFDYYGMMQSKEWKSGLLYGLPQPPTPSYDDDTGSAWSWTLWAERLSGPGYPEAEVRALYRFDANDRFVGSSTSEDWLKRLDAGMKQVDLRRIRAPVLAIYAVPGSAEVMLPYWQTLDASARDRASKMYLAVRGVIARLGSDFQERVAHVRVVKVPGARHYIFLTHPGEVTHAMLEFLQG